MSEWYRMKMGEHNLSEMSVETSSDMTDPYLFFSDNLSPISAPIVPRKLDFSSIDDEDGIKDASPAPASLSPPYNRVRALRLFDSPHTPKSLLEKCSTPSHPPPRWRLFPPKLNASSGSSQHLHPPGAQLDSEDSALGLQDEGDELPPRRLANINPFTPNGQALNNKKRSLSKTPNWEDSTSEQPAKRLRESNISRYKVEFVELGVVGRGEFGVVTRCVNKLDGCEYALKRSLRPLAGSAAERRALTEVYAHAAAGRHPGVVRYYSAWAEDCHMIIQNEYCEGGSLAQRLEAGALRERELAVLLAHVADALAHFHAQRLVHMDVKPANVFLCRNLQLAEDEDDDDLPSDIHYKLGDLGHVTCVTAPAVEEGDCRYLPKEVLQEDYAQLPKADVFALGLTLFEAAGGGPLPKNGQQWHDIRDGKLPDLPSLSHEFNMLLKKMVDPDPTVRPTAAQLKKHPLLHPAGNKTRSQLSRELAAAKLRTELLERKLDDAKRCIKSLTPNSISNQKSAKFRTRAAMRQQKPRIDSNIAEMIQSVTSPLLTTNERRTAGRRPKKT